LEHFGITELYPPQEEAITSVERDESVLLAVPTAAGKTLVAYLALLRTVAAGRRGMYLVPLRALAWEKVEELHALTAAVLPQARVGVSVGDYDRTRGLSNCDIIVATSERADSLLRHSPEWLPQVGCLVADEVHLLNDTGRGPTLEVTLTRFRELVPDLQLVALSATVSNAAEIADWLGATLVSSDFRPVPLARGIYTDTLLEWETAAKQVLPRAGAEGLVQQRLPDQSLVFVATRRGAEAQAKRLAPIIDSTLSSAEREALVEAADALETGADEATSFDHGLAQLLRRGVAFHHAGLTNRHRKLVEAQFRARRLKALVATPTLAAGVNLPARRVIVRDLKRWESSFQSNQPLPILEVHQMLGRAGRPGYDAEGEGVLMAKDVAQAEEAESVYFRGEPEPVVSRLGSEPALRTHLLALIAVGAVSDREALHSFLDRTLFGAQGELWRTQHRLNRVIEFLREEGLITVSGAEPGEFAPASEAQREEFTATDFGRRVAQLYVDPLTGVTMRRALESGVPPNPLGLLHMVARTPNIHSLYVRKQEMEKYLVRMMNAEDELMLPTPEDQVEMEFYLWDLKTALLLQDWTEEMPEEQMLKRYSTTPGDIRAKVDVAEWLLYAAGELARLLAPEAVAELEQLRTRITHGVRRELLPLLALPGVGRIRARELFNHGSAAPDAFATATETELARVPGIGPLLAQQLAGRREPEQTTL
jgi:helicase